MPIAVMVAGIEAMASFVGLGNQVGKSGAPV
jgi:hypothetical protein